MNARYVHTNLIARDWRTLAAFYQTAFGCTLVPPERDLSGPWLDRVTGIEDAHLRGVHLRLPGHGDAGPTLEIFQYEPDRPGDRPVINRSGYGHLAFEVDDVQKAREDVLAAGGKEYGQLVSLPVPGKGTVTCVYLTDPEGNIIELQSWKREQAGLVPAG